MKPRTVRLGPGVTVVEGHERTVPGLRSIPENVNSTGALHTGRSVLFTSHPEATRRDVNVRGDVVEKRVGSGRRSAFVNEHHADLRSIETGLG